MAAGNEALSALQAAGFAPEEIQAYEAKTRRTLHNVGFSAAEVDAHFGNTHPDSGRIRSYFDGVNENVTKQHAQKSLAAEDKEKDTTSLPDIEDPNAGPIVADTFAERVQAGFQNSVTGLAMRNELPDVVPDENDNWLERAATSFGTLGGDLPAFVLGGALGFGLGSTSPDPLTTVAATGAGAFAVPSGLRALYIDMIKKGTQISGREWLDRILAVSWESTKGAVTGALTATAGAVTKTATAAFAARGLPQTVVAGGAVTAAEVTTLATVAAGLEGRIPEQREFVDAAVIILGLKATQKGIVHTGKRVTEKMAARNKAQEESVLRALHLIYVETGRTPAEVLADMQKNPTIKQEIITNPETVPNYYSSLIEAQEKPVISKVPESEVSVTRNPRPEGEAVAVPDADVAAVVKRLETAVYADGKVFFQDGVPHPIISQTINSQGKKVKQEAGWFDRETGVFYNREQTQALIERVDASGKVQAEASSLKHFQKKETAKAEPTPVDKMTPQEKVLERIAAKEKRKGYTWDQWYTDYVNDLHPIFQIVKQMSEGEKLPAIEHAGKLAQLTRDTSGKAGHFIEFGTFDYKTFKNNGKSLGEIVKKGFGDNIDRYTAVLISKRAVELEAKGHKTGVDIEAAKAVVEGMTKKEHKAFRESVEWRNRLLQVLVDGQVLEQKHYDAMVSMHQDYVPFFRLMLEGEQKGRSAGKGLSVRQPVKRLSEKGSERQILDPLESDVKSAYLYLQLADRNAVGLALVELARKTKSDLIKPVKTKARPIQVQSKELAKFLEENGFENVSTELLEGLSIFRPEPFKTLNKNEIVVFEKGKRQVYEVPEAVADSFRALSRADIDPLIKILSVPASMLRGGAVLNPDFALKNVARDQMEAMLNTDTLFIPFAHSVQGLGALLRKNEHYQEWLKSGAPNAAMVNIDKAYISQRVFQVDKQTGFINKTWNVVKSPYEFLRMVTEISENATRLGVFINEGKGKPTSKANTLEKGLTTREATLDFQRAGMKARAINMISAFWNVSVQGPDRMVRRMKANPAAFTTKALMGITLPSVLLWAAQKDDPRYQNVPQWQKDLFWVVVTDDVIYRIPKAHAAGILFGTMPERILEHYVRDNPHAFDDLWETLASQIPNPAPTAATVPIEVMTNHSFYTGNNIIPQRLEGGLPEYEYTEYTTELTKGIAQIIGAIPGFHESKLASPMNIDHFIRGWTGGLGQYTLELADKSLREAGFLPDPVKPKDTLADIPFVKAFIIRDPSANAAPITRFYEESQRMQRVYTTVQRLAKDGDFDAMLKEIELNPAGAMVRMRDTKDTLSELSQLVRMVHKNEGISSDEKRQLIDAAYKNMLVVAEAGLLQIEQAEQVLADFRLVPE